MQSYQPVAVSKTHTWTKGRIIAEEEESYQFNIAPKVLIMPIWHRLHYPITSGQCRKACCGRLFPKSHPEEVAAYSVFRTSISARDFASTSCKTTV